MPQAADAACHSGPTRALRVLLAGFGFLFGLLVGGVGLLASWTSRPVRVDFAYVAGDPFAGTVGRALDYSSLIVVVTLPLLGAVLGWVAAVVAGRRGWRLARGGS
ncbi:hypothetical protein [Rhodococcus sp. SGAir0479]|uniref:hypothetical protein n=1 Tax=Rhodococcus sp. SGAir0479 TaxID=2567884 RepID=UPI0010CD0640|nr:hypothetical protein [Rhodococcus sp. SGAir0479]QCQ93853.1 hypothetical protein E7742_09130 [Rhodococcus sp. SGAir0479]